MTDYISREECIQKLKEQFCSDCEGKEKCGRPSLCWVVDVIDTINSIPTADVRPVVLCKDCLHYEMGVCLKIYDDGAANKDAWQERKPDDYCSYGEDRNVPTNCGADMRPTPMSGANGEES